MPLPPTGHQHQCLSCSIRHLSVFAGIPVDCLAQTVQDFHPSIITLASHQTLYYQGDPVAHAYTVRSGFVKLIHLLPNGRSQIVRVLHTGDILGFEGLVGGKYAHTAVTLTDTQLCRLPLPELSRLKHESAYIDAMLMQRWIQQLAKAEGMLVELGAKKTAERLGTFLLRWYDTTPQGIEGWVTLPLSRVEIGELLGMTVETVSRTLSDWKRLNLFQEQQGLMRLPDREGLCQAVCHVSLGDVLYVG